jgi:hypothetical protein
MRPFTLIHGHSLAAIPLVRLVRRCWRGCLCREVNISLEEAQATLAALALIAGERKGNAAFALADLLSWRG